MEGPNLKAVVDKSGAKTVMKIVLFIHKLTNLLTLPVIIKKKRDQKFSIISHLERPKNQKTLQGKNMKRIIKTKCTTLEEM